MTKRILIAITILVMISHSVFGRDVNIAVQIAYDARTTQNDWNEFAQFLHKKIPEHNFKVDLLLSTELKKAEIQNKYEYIIANPELYVDLEYTAGAMRIATMTHSDKKSKFETARYGGVIFVKSDRADINNVNDIKGKKIVSPNSFGAAAYLLQIDALDSAGVKIDKSEITFLQTNHNTVVKKVLDGSYDVGFVRSGVLERMAHSGVINLSQVKILNINPGIEIADIVSTKLIPEWPLMAMPDSEAELTERIISSLIMADKEPNGNYNPVVLNWTIPQDYSYVATLMRKYKIPPFDTSSISLEDVAKNYSVYISMIVLMIFMILSTLIFYMRRNINKRKLLERELLDRRYSLEQTVRDRTKQLELATISINSSSDGMFLVRPNSHIINVNQAACELLGYSKIELQSMFVPDIDVDMTFEVWAKTIEQLRLDGFISREAECKKKDGGLVDVSLVANLIEFDGQEYIFASLRDISNIKEAQQKINEGSEKLRGLYELAPVGIILNSMDGKFVDFNDAFKKICGYDSDELREIDYWALTPKKYEADEAKQLHLLSTVGSYGPYEKEYIKKDGTLVPLCLNGVLITGSDGNKYIWSIVEDISERKAVDDKLRALNSKLEAEMGRYKILMESASDGIHILDLHGDVVEYNEKFMQMLGYSESEMDSINVAQWEVTIPKDEILSAIAELIKSPAIFETKHKRKDGTIIDVEINAKSIEIDGLKYLYASSRDISERINDKKTIQHSEEKFRTIFEQSLDGIAIIDPMTQKFMDFNPMCHNRLGYTREEFAQLTVGDVDANEKPHETIQRIKTMQESGWGSFEAQHRTKSGELRDMYVTTKMVEINNQKFIFATFHDITDEKRADMVKQEAEKTLALAVQSGGIGVWIWNLDTNTLSWDDRMFELYGCHRDDFVAAYDAWVARIHSDDKDEQEKISADAVNGLREYNTEFRILHPDGNLRYIKASAIVLRDDRGNPLKMIGTNWDITEQKLHEEHLQGLVQTEITKRLENERMLLQQSKMAMMGEMMGAIAHQWRQPLNSLGIKIQDVMVSHAVGELDDEYVREFQDSSMILIQRMSKTIDDFRNFFKPVDKKSDFDLKSAFEDSMNIIGVQLKSYGIGVGFVSDSSSLVNGYKGELEQAILIIMSNAQDKLLENKTKNPKIDISIKEIESSKIELSINDNAGGVPEEIIDRIFEPYFTTKFQMQGTGIGLYIAKEIVERHMNGKLTVQNANGGARFSMVFDLAKSLQ